MPRRVLVFIALAASMLYGVVVGTTDFGDSVAPVGGVVVALLWISVGLFGRDDGSGRNRNRRRYRDDRDD